MRNSIMLAFALLFGATTASASDWSEHRDAMNKAITSLDREALAATADAIGEDDQLETAWRHYWQAYANYRMIYLGDGNADYEAAERCARYADQAAKELEESQRAEALALKASCLGQLAAQGGMAGMRYGPASGQALRTAQQLAPMNARVRLLAAVSQLYMPPSYGGDPQAAAATLSQLVDNMPEDAVSEVSAPRWGVADASMHLLSGHRMLENKDAACGVWRERPEEAHSGPWQAAMAAEAQTLGCEKATID